MTMRQLRLFSITSASIAAAGLLACSQPPDPPKPPPTPAQAMNTAASALTGVADPHAAGSIAWRKGDIDAAFAAAKAERLPVFLYWGAVWCPPCNQVKATIFNRQDFIERASHFVPVYLDGDTPSAQKLGARFNVSGYPTMILFTPDGREITRLPGEVDADQYMRVLALGMSGTRPVKDALAAALSPAGHAKLTQDDWRMLAFYSWVEDEQQLVPKQQLPVTLRRLAQACPADQADSATRLELKALAAAATAKGAKPAPDVAAVGRVAKVLADEGSARENFDTLTEYPSEITGFITAPKSPERAQLVAAWTAALERLASDTSLSMADRLTAITGEVQLAKLDAQGPLPVALLDKVRSLVTRADRETNDPYARQAVISQAADALTEAGLLDESDALLKAELKRSHSPYYFMVDLALNAKKRGDKAGAIDWYAQSYAAAEGPATRLQWGVRYVNALTELAPKDVPRVEQAAKSVIGELEPVPDTFYERNLRGLERMGVQLTAWGKDPAQAAALARIRTQFSAVCAKLPAGDPARAKCSRALHPQAVRA
jgi:thioredoxin-like negative regulator of GroEL